MNGLTRVDLPGGGSIVACRWHLEPTRHGRMAHSPILALAMAASWIDRKQPAAVFALAIPATLPGPPCCPSAGLAQETMMAAFRELTRGEG